MKPAPRNDKAREGVPGQVGKANSIEPAQFATSNPRHQRALALLWNRPAKREELDRVAGCANFPDLAAELRRRGLELPSERVPAIDRDGKDVRVGVYRLSDQDRRKLTRWMTTRGAA